MEVGRGTLTYSAVELVEREGIADVVGCEYEYEYSGTAEDQASMIVSV